MRTIFCWLLLLTANCLFAKNGNFIPKRIFDVTYTPIEEYYVKAHLNITLPCPGANEFTLVRTLEWYSLTHDKVVMRFSEASLTVFIGQDRITLAKSNGMVLQPALASDTGDYICLINNRLAPDAVVQVKVLDVPDPPGRPLIVSFTSRTANLSWASPPNMHFSPVKYYVIHTR